MCAYIIYIDIYLWSTFMCSKCPWYVNISEVDLQYFCKVRIYCCFHFTRWELRHKDSEWIAQGYIGNLWYNRLGPSQPLTYMQVKLNCRGRCIKFTSHIRDRNVKKNSRVVIYIRYGDTYTVSVVISLWLGVHVDFWKNWKIWAVYCGLDSFFFFFNVLETS